MPKKKVTPASDQVPETQPLPGTDAVAEGLDAAEAKEPAENPAVEAETALADAPIAVRDNEEDWPMDPADSPEADGISGFPPGILPPGDFPEILSIERETMDGEEPLEPYVEEGSGAYGEETAEGPDGDFPEKSGEEAAFFGRPDLEFPAQEPPPRSAVPPAQPPESLGMDAVDDAAAGDEKPRKTPVRTKAARRAEEPKAAAEGGGSTPQEDAAKNINDRQAFFDLDFHTLDRDLTPEQRKEWNSIYASYRGRSVLTGEIVGIDKVAVSMRNRSTGEMVRQLMYCAVVIPYRVRILIPSSEMWMKGGERPDFVLRNMSGAIVDFVIIHVDRKSGLALASRRLAMAARRYYFSTSPSLNRPGTRIQCHVMAIGPRRCLVECYGYDIDLTQREMRYAAIPDLRTEYQRGQELDCIVKEYDRRRGMLMVSVKETEPNPFDGAEMRHPEDSRRQAVIAGKYAGGVFCNLPDGVVVMCNYSFQYEDSEFAIGERVMVMIQRYDYAKKQIYGKIVAKW